MSSLPKQQRKEDHSPDGIPWDLGALIDLWTNRVHDAMLLQLHLESSKHGGDSTDMQLHLKAMRFMVVHNVYYKKVPA